MTTPKTVTVITLHGHSGSGKDSTYQELRLLNPNLPRVSFGDLLREELYEVIGMNADQVGDERELKTYPHPLDPTTQIDTTFKDLMVLWGRKQILCDPFHYTRGINYRIRLAAGQNSNPLVVVTDCRRPHELQLIRSRFPTYSFWLTYTGSTVRPLDRILYGYPGIHDLGDGTIKDNAEQIIDHMIRDLPYPAEFN